MIPLKQMKPGVDLKQSSISLASNSNSGVDATIYLGKL